MATDATQGRRLTIDEVGATVKVLFDLPDYGGPDVEIVLDGGSVTINGLYTYAGRRDWDDSLAMAMVDVSLDPKSKGKIAHYDRNVCFYPRPSWDVAVELHRRKQLELERLKDEKDGELKTYLSKPAADKPVSHGTGSRTDKGVGEGSVGNARRAEDAAREVDQLPGGGEVATQEARRVKPKIEPRPYQQIGLSRVREAIVSGKRRILLVAPTGAGKMVMAGLFMSAAADKGRRSIFVADQRELVHQCVDKLQGFGVPVSTMMANSDYEDVNAVTWVASKDTLYHRAFKNTKATPPSAGLLIGDEAHKSLSMTWGKVLKHYFDAGAVVIGMTATPCRMDGRGLGDQYDELIVIATYKELRDGGFIVPCKVYAPSEPDLAGIKTVAGDYNRKDVNGKVDTAKLVGDVVKDWRKRADGRQTFVFANGVFHSIHLRNQFRRHGISAEHIDAKYTQPEEREDIMRRFSAGEVTVLCNYGIATTGIDVPAASCVVCVRPTKSFSLWRQMCGRGLRSSPGKEDLLVIDHAGNVYRHGFPDEDVEWELTTSDEIAFKKKADNAGAPCRVCGHQYKGPQCPKCGDQPPPREPNVCSECAATFRGPECPSCGAKPALRGKAITMTPGELKEIERAKLNRTADPKQKEKDWKSFIGIAIHKGSTMSMAFTMYKSKYGVAPPHGLKFMPKGKEQWAMKAKDFYQKWQNHHNLGEEIS